MEVDFIKDDLEQISKKVKEHYLADYSKYWIAVLDKLNISDFLNLKQASDTLVSFTDPVYSPLISILQVIKENTQLTAPLMSNLLFKSTDSTKKRSLNPQSLLFVPRYR